MNAYRLAFPWILAVLLNTWPHATNAQGLAPDPQTSIANYWLYGIFLICAALVIMGGYVIHRIIKGDRESNTWFRWLCSFGETYGNANINLDTLQNRLKVLQAEQTTANQQLLDGVNSISDKLQTIQHSNRNDFDPSSRLPLESGGNTARGGKTVVSDDDRQIKTLAETIIVQWKNERAQHDALTRSDCDRQIQNSVAAVVAQWKNACEQTEISLRSREGEIANTIKTEASNMARTIDTAASNMARTIDTSVKEIPSHLSTAQKQLASVEAALETRCKQLETEQKENQKLVDQYKCEQDQAKLEHEQASNERQAAEKQRCAAQKIYDGAEALLKMLWPACLQTEDWLNWRQKLLNDSIGETPNPLALLLVSRLGGYVAAEKAGDVQALREALREISRALYRLLESQKNDADQAVKEVGAWAEAFNAQSGGRFRLRIAHPGDPATIEWMTYRPVGNTVVKAETWCVTDGGDAAIYKAEVST